MRHRRLLLLTTAFALAALLGAVNGSYAKFAEATLSDANAITATSTYRAPSAARTTTASTVVDLASGTAIDRSFGLADGTDTLYELTASWSNAFSATRYYEADFGASLPGGNAVTSPTLNVSVSNNGSGTVCFYAEIDRISAPTTVVGTYGSSGSPYCHSTATAQAFAIAAPEVTSTTVVNDLRVRLYMTTAFVAARIHRLTFSGTMMGHAFDQVPETVNDRADGTPSAAPWALSVNNDDVILATGSWTNTFNAARYVEYRMPSTLPPGATITGATFTHAWRTNAGGPAGTSCVYYQVWTSSAQVGASINQASPTCNNSKTTPVSETVTLPALTLAQANDLRIRTIVRNTANREIQVDRVAATLTWSRW